MLRLYQIAVTAKTAVLRTLFYFLKDRPQIGNYESYYSGSQQCGSYFSLDNYPVKLLSGQHCALLKKIAHRLVWASPVAELSRDWSVPSDLQHLLIGVSCRCSRESHVSPHVCTASVPRSHRIPWLFVFHCVPPMLTGGLCCQPGRTLSIQRLQAWGRWSIPGEVRSTFGTSCYQWIIPKKRCWYGFQLQFKLRNSSCVVIIFIKRIRFFFQHEAELKSRLERRVKTIRKDSI